MRIALFPQITLTKIRGDSAFGWARRNAQAFAEQGDECFILVPTADNVKDASDLPVIPGVHYVNVNRRGSFYGMHPNISELFRKLHPREGELLCDVVYTNQVATASALAGFQTDCNEQDRYILVVNDVYAFSPYASTTKTHYNATKLGGENEHSYAELRALSYPYADRVIFDTPLEYKAGMDGARRMLSAYAMREFEKRSRTMPGGIVLKRIVEAREKWAANKFEQFTLFFGGRLNDLKRPELMLEAYVRHMAYGRHPKIIVTSPKADSSFYNSMSAVVREVVEFETNLSSDEFLERACRSHVAVYPSKGEGFSFGVLEMVLSGLVMILPDLPWVHALLGDSVKNYPFLFKTTDEIQGHLLYVSEHYETAVEKMKPVQEFVMQNYSHDKCFKVIRDDLAAMHNGMMSYYDRDKYSSSLQLIADCAKTMPEQFSMDMLIKEVVDKADALKASNFSEYKSTNKKYPSRLGIKRLLEALNIAKMTGTGQIFTRL